MKRTYSFLIFLSLFAVGCARHEPCTVMGTVLGYDGQPLTPSVVQLSGGFQHPALLDLADTLIAQASVASDGHFSLSIPSGGAYRLSFLGVGHTVLDVPVVIEGERQVNMNVRLSRAVIDPNVQEVRVQYAFDGGPLDSIGILARAADGSFQKTVSPPGVFVRFAIGYTRDSYWGIEADHFELLPDGRYAAYVPSGSDGKCRLVVHSTPEPIPHEVPAVQFADSTSVTARVTLALLDHHNTLRAYDAALLTHLRSGGDRRSFSWNWQEKVKSITAMRASARADLVRDEYALELLELGSLFPQAVPHALLQDAARSVDAASPLWVYRGSLPLFANRVLGRERDVASGIIARHPSENYRAFLLFTEARDCEMRGERHKADSLMECIYRSYRGTTVGASADIWGSRRGRVSPFTALPPFRLTSLDDPALTFTNASFKGKTLLIDFWTTRCGPCIALMPSLHDFYKRYHKKGLEILSISMGDSNRLVQKFRATRWPMPWSHAVVPREQQAEIMRTFGGGTPSIILVDTSGIVLGAEPENLRTYLDSALVALFPARK